jgi:hypothetical protein
MLQRGKQTSDILLFCQQEFCITKRTAYLYIERVKDAWVKDERRLAPEDRAIKRRKQLEKVYNIAISLDPPDLKAANQALGLLCRLDQCFETPAVQIHNTLNVLTGMDIGELSPHQRRARIIELLASRDQVRKHVLKPGNGKGNGGGNGRDIIDVDCEECEDDLDD